MEKLDDIIFSSTSRQQLGNGKSDDPGSIYEKREQDNDSSNNSGDNATEKHEKKEEDRDESNLQ